MHRLCPYRMGERVRALKLLRSVTKGILLMWERGLHSYAMVEKTVASGCDYLGRIPKNVKFPVEKPMDDGSYCSWINPPAKLGKKGCQEPQFFADSFFVKKPERVETILFIMSLCLLVYNLGQRELRKTLL